MTDGGRSLADREDTREQTEHIARILHDANTGRITPDPDDPTPYGEMARQVYAGVVAPLVEQRNDHLAQLARAVVLPEDAHDRIMALGQANVDNCLANGIIYPQDQIEAFLAGLKAAALLAESWRGVATQPARLPAGEPHWPHRNGCTGCDHPPVEYPACWTAEQVARDQAADEPMYDPPIPGAQPAQPAPEDAPSSSLPPNRGPDRDLIVEVESASHCRHGTDLDMHDYCERCEEDSGGE